jgi:hypothetical protein
MTSRSNRTTLAKELLREVNDRIAATAAGEDENLSFLCECADDFCINRVVLSRSGYDAIREEGGNVFAPGHRGDSSQS